MYLAHFKLTAHPFRAHSQTNFYFSGADRGEILAALRAAILSSKGLMTVTGDAGSGKTLLCQVLAAQLPEEVSVIHLGSTAWMSADLPLIIAQNLGASIDDTPLTAHIRLLQKLLLERHMAGKQSVILIDDAHAMPDKTLEEVRQLSSLDHHHQKLLQIVLLGQPPLNDRLLNPPLYHLRERIAFRFELAPLNAADTAAYINWRLQAAGHRGSNLFSKQALRLISRVSAGSPRRINQLADRSLQSACSEGSYEILARHTRAAIAGRRFTLCPSMPQLMGGLALVSSLFLGLIWILQYPGKASDSLLVPPNNLALPTQLPASTLPAQSVATEDPPAQPRSSAPEASSLALAPSPIALSLNRLEAAPAGALAIMIGAADNTHQAEMEILYSSLLGQLPEEQVLILPARLNGRMGWGVFYGFFQDRNSAVKMLANLPETLRKHRPFIRTVEGMKSELHTP